MAETSYTVKPGDSLSKIAKELWGDAKRWHEIFEANRDQIKDPNLIRVGQQLRIPGAAEEPKAAPIAYDVLSSAPAPSVASPKGVSETPAQPSPAAYDVLSSAPRSEPPPAEQAANEKPPERAQGHGQLE